MQKIDIQILDTDLNPQTCIDFVTNPASGGINVFVGTVRNQTKGKTVVRLDFETYRPMAISEMRKIAERACEQWPIEKISMHHRVGTLNIEGIAVVIAVATPHRKASFEACQFAIDTLKETVPIWKKEIFEDGEVWVAAHP
ncbi:MAG: molybdenum cofactor biosynthesis protein MoaE [Bacteroidota bacterium]